MIRSHSRDPGLQTDTHWAGDFELLFFAEVRTRIACTLTNLLKDAMLAGPALDLCVLAAEQVPPVGYAAYTIKLSQAPGDSLEHDECSDKQAICAKWAEDGECGRNAQFMHTECPRSCAMCPIGSVHSKGTDAAAAARSTLCTTSPVAAGTMRCHAEEQYREEVTYYNVTDSFFNNETNATEVLVTTNQNTSMVLESSTVRTVSI